jgi:hypothetical protein
MSAKANAIKRYDRLVSDLANIEKKRSRKLKQLLDLREKLKIE